MYEMNQNDKYTVLITGCAGFIGGALALHLVETTMVTIVGVDNLNDYYDVRLKLLRLDKIKEKARDGRFKFIEADISNKNAVDEILELYTPDIIIHFAAQAGIRYSIENPELYIQSNIVGFFNMIEACRSLKEHNPMAVKHFLYASSSSVYGNNKIIPYSTKNMTDKPVSLYAATKKADELMAYSYSKLYDIPMTGMRFFTVYGPFGRPDMAYYKFANHIVNGEKIELFNEGKNKRDFTYIDDVVNCIERLIYSFPNKDEEGVRHKIYNIGNNNPIDVITLVNVLVASLKQVDVLDDSYNIEENIKLVERQPGDVEITYADIDDLYRIIGYRPSTNIEKGLLKFAKWYKHYRLLD